MEYIVRISRDNEIHFENPNEIHSMGIVSWNDKRQKSMKCKKNEKLEKKQQKQVPILWHLNIQWTLPIHRFICFTFHFTQITALLSDHWSFYRTKKTLTILDHIQALFEISTETIKKLEIYVWNDHFMMKIC